MVVATARTGSRRVPAFARELDPRIVQLHSSEYRNPAQLRTGGVLRRRRGQLRRRDRVRARPRTHRLPARRARASGQIPVRHGSLSVPARASACSGSSCHHVLTRRHADRPQARPEARVARRPADPGAGEGPRRRGRRARGAGRRRPGRPAVLEDGRVARRRERHLVHRASGTTSRGSTCRSSTSDGEPRHDRGVVERSRACTSSGWSSSTRRHPTCFPGRGRDAGTSRSTSGRIGERRERSSLRRRSPPDVHDSAVASPRRMATTHEFPTDRVHFTWDVEQRAGAHDRERRHGRLRDA